MVEPFKNRLNKSVVEGVAMHFESHWSDFRKENFIAEVMKDLPALELKSRTECIANSMVKFLPDDFNHASSIILSSLGPPLLDRHYTGKVDEQGISGWVVTALTRYVSLKGLNHFDLSMLLLKEMTQRLTAEFDIRFFLLNDTQKTLNTLQLWVSDPSLHVRRLVSEGTRPRLPWGMHLQPFIKNPLPVIQLLDQLKDDQAHYVRHSVANNLNDIAKDHPDLVADLVEKWMTDASKERQRLLRHACRTLIKTGHKKTLKIFGYHPAQLGNINISIENSEISMGNAILFSLSMHSVVDYDQDLFVDYAIYYKTARGKYSSKIFKWKTLTLAGKEEIVIVKKHMIKRISTRNYYPGRYKLGILVNGCVLTETYFDLTID